MSPDQKRPLLCRGDELAEGRPVEVTLDDGRILVLVRHNGKVHAFDGECPHEGAPLADGEVEDGVLTCCLHFWSWEIESGRPREGARVPLVRHRVEEGEDGIRLAE